MVSREASALLVGDGGREHQLAMSIAAMVETLYATGNNPGIAAIENAINYGYGTSELGNIVKLAVEKGLFTIIGPETPLIQGLADRLREKGVLVFGPGADGAWLEGSKYFAYQFNDEFDIPQPETYMATNYQQAMDVLGNDADRFVIKADRNAAGKGVEEPLGYAAAELVIRGMLDGSLAGGAGKDCILFQERLSGPEVSVTVLFDGRNYMLLPNSQDHKKLLDGDKGPNTGGMGAYAPVPSFILSPFQQSKIDSIAGRVTYGLRQRGINYRGAIKIDIMLADQRQGDPVVLEYNCRFGDPETQAILPVIEQKGADIYGLLRSAAEGHLPPNMYLNGLIGATAVPVCVAAPGYPNKPKTGSVISGLDREYPNVIIQHGSTKRQGENIVTDGGRVLYVTGLGATLNEAAKNAYAAIGEDNNGVHFPDMVYRKDIAGQAIEEEV